MPWLPALGLLWLGLFGFRLAIAAFGCALVMALFYCAAIRDLNSDRKVLRALTVIMATLTLLAVGLYFGTAADSDGPRMCGGYVQC